MSRMGLSAALALVIFIASQAHAQVVQTYTLSQQSPTQRSLGYPVPLPIDSLTPLDGFRSYDSLHARLQALALESSDVAAHRVGTTFNGQPIWAYVISTADSVNAEGRAKPAFFINATTHAREWGAPEVAVGLVERLATATESDGLVRYLLANSRLVIIPVQNVDGFQQTQRFPTQVVVGQDPRVPSDWPRDGRMRRKNMRGVDQALTTFGDHLLGVDLNRNHSPFWGTTTLSGQLNNPLELTFRGAAAQSEPELAAILAAADLGPVSRMRMAVDLHSFARLFFSSNTGRARLNAVQARLLATTALHHAAVPTAEGTANGREYVDVPDPANRGIGAAAEYFAYQWLVPAWTLELEPGSVGSAEYGGSNDSHGGFILPESQVRRVREAWAESFITAFYFMTGAPHLRSLTLASADTGAMLQKREWLTTPGAERRTLSNEATGRIEAGQRLAAKLSFSKPMRRVLNGQPEGLPGIFVDLLPQVWLAQGANRTALDVRDGQWLENSDYPGTSSTFEFTFDAPTSPAEFTLEVAGRDMTGLDLDANPASPIDWASGAWTGWNATVDAASEGDGGGVDASMQLQVSAAAPGRVPRIVSALPTMAGEGDVIELRLVLDAPAEGIVEVLGEEPEFTRLRAVVSPPPPAPPAAVWALGEQGERTLLIGLTDDVLVQGDRMTSIRLGLSFNGAAILDLSSFLDYPLLQIDNDRAEQPVLNLRVAGAAYTAAWRESDAVVDTPDAFASATAGGPRVEIVARRHQRYVLPRLQGPRDPVTISGDVFVHGEASTFVVPVDQVPSTLFEVLEGARLTLDHATVSAPSVLPSRPVDQASRPLFDNAGQLTLSRSDIDSIDGEFAALVSGSGETRIERTSIRGWKQSPVLATTGLTKMASSSVINGVSPESTVSARGITGVEWSSLVGNQAALARFGAVEQGSLRWLGSLLQNNTSLPTTAPGASDCAGSISSSGYNLHDASSCVGSAEGDVAGVSIGLPNPTPPSLKWVPPIAAALNAGGECPTVDQRGAPRPQTLSLNAAARCDVGAIEAGINPYRGIWQPARSGHGVDLQTSGNRLLLLWYTYSDDGQPTAYQAVAPLSGPIWRAELQLSRRNPETGVYLTPVRVGTVGIDFASDVSATLRWRFDSRGVDGSEQIRPSLFSLGEPDVDVTGLWFPPAESGYGATITRRGSVTAAAMYYYDATGALRWALGTGGAESAGEMVMNGYTGFCPDCDASMMPVQATPIGRVLFHFLTPRRARIDVDLTYPGASGGVWRRERADFVPLNDPVDNAEAVLQTQ